MEQSEEKRIYLKENSIPCKQYHFKVHSSQKRSMSATPFIQKFNFLKEGVVLEQSEERRKYLKRSMSATPFIQKFDFLKEEVVWEQRDERRECWGGVLDNVWNIISMPFYPKELRVCNSMQTKI